MKQSKTSLLGQIPYETPSCLAMDLKAESAFLQTSETPTDGMNLPLVTLYELEW